jgi:hypothetical protein
MRPLLPIVALCALLASAGLVACGGGGGGSASSSSASTAATSGSSSSTASAAPPAFLGHAEAAAKTAAERRRAGRAGAFVKPRADNSVPTFGSEAGTSERARAEAALKAYLRARAKADWPSACRHLAASTRQGFEKLAKSSSKAKALGCAQILKALSKGADLSDPLIGGVLSLRVQGANAFALFYGPHRQRYIVPMAKEGNAWRLTQSAPIAYPPGAPPTTTSP